MSPTAQASTIRPSLLLHWIFETFVTWCVHRVYGDSTHLRLGCMRTVYGVFS